MYNFLDLKYCFRPNSVLLIGVSNNSCSNVLQTPSTFHPSSSTRSQFPKQIVGNKTTSQVRHYFFIFRIVMFIMGHTCFFYKNKKLI